jgi:large subunit ribosomal protein L9
MEVVLLQRVEKLGQMGDVVRVRDGFGRNYLLPQGKALRANKVNLAKFEAQRAQLEARNLELKKEAEAVAAKLSGKAFIVIRQASDGGSLFGSVTGRDIAEAATEGGFTVERGQIALDRPIKELGLHPVRVILHPEVDAKITVNVARTREEAEIQASGKTVAEIRAAEEAAEQAEFDVQQLFDDEEDAPKGAVAHGMEVVDAEDDLR